MLTPIPGLLGWEIGNFLKLKKIKKGEVLSTVESVGRQDSKDNLYELRMAS